VLKPARIVVANSERTRIDLIRDVGLAPERVRTVYLGSDSEWRTFTPERRAAARAWLGKPPDRPLAVFVGGFGHDSRKGFDILWAAWQKLCTDREWDVDLVVAGGGRTLNCWRTRISDAGLQRRVKMLGFTNRVGELLAAADLLVSPARYEPYGLNVQEAVCFGVPSIVSARAGVAERYPEELRELLLPDPEDIGDLVARMRRWKSDMIGFKNRTKPLAQAFRDYTWKDMARRMVEIIDETGAFAPAKRSDLGR
jgi:glycosyltransferase involved in cell wall biosynthesis